MADRTFSMEIVSQDGAVFQALTVSAPFSVERYFNLLVDQIRSGNGVTIATDDGEYIIIPNALAQSLLFAIKELES